MYRESYVSSVFQLFQFYWDANWWFAYNCDLNVCLPHPFRVNSQRETSEIFFFLEQQSLRERYSLGTSPITYCLKMSSAPFTITLIHS